MMPANDDSDDISRLIPTVEELAQRLRAGGFSVNALTLTTDTKGAGAILDCGERTLRDWRTEGKGPVWLRSPGYRYPLAGIVKFLKNSRKQPE